MEEIGISNFVYDISYAQAVPVCCVLPAGSGLKGSVLLSGIKDCCGAVT
jgi:uncharacterized membrane protein